MCYEYKILQHSQSRFSPVEVLKHFYCEKESAECNICSRNARVHYSNKRPRIKKEKSWEM